MPPTKAAKKAAKKAVKKSAKTHDSKHHEQKDTRRAYEHLGRVSILQHSLTGDALISVRTLAELSHRELQFGRPGDSADLLRAAEHLAFASLASDEQEVISRDLKATIEEERERLLHRAEEHLDPEASLATELVSLYKSARKASNEAFKKNCYHRAMEFARAAEALTHVKSAPQKRLKAGEKTLRLATKR